MPRPHSSTPRVLKVSTPNAAYQHIEVLRRNRTKRHRYREFVVEGVRDVNAAISGGWTIKSFAFARGRELSRWAQSVLDESTAEEHYDVVPELFDRLSDKDEPGELLAVIAQRSSDVASIPVRPGMLVVVVDRPGNPGNLGTIIRSSDAFGAAGVIVTGHGVDLHDPATIRASVGSFFAVPMVALPSHREFADWLDGVRRSFPGLTLVGTSANAESLILDQPFGSEVVLVVGNETLGMSQAYRELCDVVVRIPMHGTATSLNAAVAASIALYEVDSRRG